ncbi:MAG TPA: type 4a pilus biogenesis protein PilO [Sumerlaeia bacterium]|nr:type 4a pilus biogenesis protein PilO [Sumerlaeia bacterium]
MAFNQEQKKAFMAVVIFGVIGLILMAYFWFMVFKGRVQGDKDKAVELRAELKKVESKLREIQKLRDLTQTPEYEELKRAIDEVSKLLPKSAESPEFLRELGGILRSTDIRQKRLARGALQEFALFTEIPYAIEVNGPYHEFGQFLNLVEENKGRFMRVRNLTVSNDAARPSRHPISVDIATFMFKER